MGRHYQNLASFLTSNEFIQVIEFSYYQSSSAISEINDAIISTLSESDP
jgi:hypothetical protein